MRIDIRTTWIVLGAVVCSGPLMGGATAQDVIIDVAPTEEVGKTAFSAAYAKVEIPAPVEAAIWQLDAESYLEREGAMAQLMTMEYDLDVLHAALDRLALSEEQRFRILGIARDKFALRPKGALGIRMQPARRNLEGPMEIQVIELLPDLPARDFLRVGDRIVRVQGDLLFDQSDLSNRVQRLGPGDPVDLLVRRPREDQEGRRVLDEAGAPVFDEIDVQFALGSADKLGNRPSVQSPVERERLQLHDRIVNLYGPKPIQLTFALQR